MFQSDILTSKFTNSHLLIRLSKFFLLLGDFFAFVIAGTTGAALSLLFGHDSFGWLLSQDLMRYYGWAVVCIMGLIVFLIKFRHYTDRKPFWTELGEVLIFISVLAIFDMALVAFAKWNASRLWWFLSWLTAMLLIPIFRHILRMLMTKFGLWLRPTIIIGNGSNACEAMAALISEPAMGFVVIGFVESSANPLSGECAVLNMPIIKASEVNELSKLPGVQIVVALEHAENELREYWLRNLAAWGALDVCVIPAMRGVPLFGTDISYFFSHEVAMLKLKNNLRHWPARLLKRIFDVVASFVLLLLLSPVFLFLYHKIRKDGGPVIFSHNRVGRNGKNFSCYKFRTMHVDAELQLKEILASNLETRAEWESEFKLKNDPRISPIGHFLRRSSLDELPQLLNVIKGDMSLVGPRPVVNSELLKYGDNVDYFLMVRPGITGLWQVSGRNDVSYETRVYLDTWYVKNWSLWYDIAIIFKTLRVVLGSKGAY